VYRILTYVRQTCASNRASSSVRAETESHGTRFHLYFSQLRSSVLSSHEYAAYIRINVEKSLHSIYTMTKLSFSQSQTTRLSVLNAPVNLTLTHDLDTRPWPRYLKMYLRTKTRFLG